VIRTARAIRILEGVTLAYVALPFVIFTLGWVKLWVAFPAAALVVAGVWCAWQRGREDPVDSGGASAVQVAQIIPLVALFLLVVFLVAYSGVGGYAFQYDDHLRHNAFLRDLIELRWPAAYGWTPPDGRPGMLAFYIANTLPSAAVGKLLGWNAANFASLIWTICGVYLAVCWFLRVTGAVSFRLGLLFLFFGGLDIVGRVVLLGWPSDITNLLGNWMVEYALSSTSEAESLMQGVFWYYPSNLSFVYYAPQHVLGPWLCTLVILYDAIHGSTCRRSVFLWSLALLWSAFAFVGLLPFVGLAVLIARGRRLWSFENTFAAGTVLALTALYIGSNNQDYPHGFLWERQNLLKTWPLLLFFYAVEFGVYAAICPRVDHRARGAMHRAWWWLSIACLLAAPWYVLGRYNDLTTKVGIPALLVFQVWIATALWAAETHRDRLRAQILVALIIVGSLASVSDLARGLHHGLELEPVPIETVKRSNRLAGPARQIFSDGDALFWRALARPTRALAPAHAPQPKRRRR
jgi:hypothetical protein